jgi:DNA repair exonuclease SbcCD ATPase subunit
MKHKIIEDFHLMGPDKNIITLKSGTILEDYIYKKGTMGELLVGKEAVEKNEKFFEIFDWKAELTAYLKSNKIPQPAVLSKKIQPFIQEMMSTTSYSTNVVSTQTEVMVDNPEHLKTIESLKRTIKEKELEIEELNNLIKKKESNINRQIDEKEKDLEFREEQLKKRKERLEDLDFELENRTKEVKNKEFEVLTWENRINQSISSLEELIKQAESIPTVVEQVPVQVAQEVARQWDGVYRGMH